MTKVKRYHPLLLLFDFFSLVKNSSVIGIYLFVIAINSQSPFVKYGRIIFFVGFGIVFISDILKWFTHKYELDGKAFHLYKGIFNKTELTIPFTKIQNVNRHISLFHRIFKVTSISFETGIKGEGDSVKFEVISQKEADRMETYIKNAVRDELAVESNNDGIDLSSSILDMPKGDSNRTIHFRPTTKDTIKASFTSLSFFVLISLLFSAYFKMDEIFHIEKTVGGIFEEMMSSWWMITIIAIILIVASIGFGIAHTFIKYGKYEISSDDDFIYITKGMIEVAAFSISKEKVQAIEINQSIIKRCLGLAEVKLISAGSDSEEDGSDVHSLYPFLPVKRAYQMVTEILPSYKVTEKMNHLPQRSFWVRLLRPSWIWLSVTVGLFFYQPSILNVEQAWWILSVALLILIIGLRLLDFFHTRYILNDRFIQLKKGSLTTSLFISKRDKIIEVSVSQNIIQKALGIASIGTINRAKPIHMNGVNDVPVELASTFYKWYMDRRNEIKVE